MIASGVPDDGELLGDVSGLDEVLDDGLDEGDEVAADDGLSDGLGELVLLVSVDVHAATTRAAADIRPITAERPLILQREV